MPASRPYFSVVSSAEDAALSSVSGCFNKLRDVEGKEVGRTIDLCRDKGEVVHDWAAEIRANRVIISLCFIIFLMLDSV